MADDTNGQSLAKVLAAKLDGLQAHVDLKFDQLRKELEDHRDERKGLESRLRTAEVNLAELKTKIAIFSAGAGLIGAALATAISRLVR